MGIAQYRTAAGYAQENWCADCEMDAELMAKRRADGRLDYKMICPNCGRSISGALGHEMLKRCGVDLAKIPEFIPEDFEEVRPAPCPRCARHPKLGMQNGRPVWCCQSCGKVVEPASERQVRRYASPHEDLPDVRVFILRAMEYEDYLLTPEWAFTRSAKIWSVGGRCEFCSSSRQLQVHHRKELGAYTRLGCERPDDLTVLCARCHRARTRLYDMDAKKKEQED